MVSRGKINTTVPSNVEPVVSLHKVNGLEKYLRLVISLPCTELLIR